MSQRISKSQRTTQPRQDFSSVQRALLSDQDLYLLLQAAILPNESVGNTRFQRLLVFRLVLSRLQFRACPLPMASYKALRKGFQEILCFQDWVLHRPITKSSLASICWLAWTEWSLARQSRDQTIWSRLLWLKARMYLKRNSVQTKVLRSLVMWRKIPGN